MAQDVPLWFLLSVPIIILVLFILMATLGGQVECKHCEWFTHYQVLKPKKCNKCGEKMNV